MNTIENCAAECPVVQGLPDDSRLELLEQHRTQCLERRMGQIGLLCGMPTGDAKNQLMGAVRAAIKQEAAVAV